MLSQNILCWEFKIVRSVKYQINQKRREDALLLFNEMVGVLLRKMGVKLLFNAGITHDQLLLYRNENDIMMDMKIMFSGYCQHIKGKEYGSLRGTARSVIVEQLIKKKATPSEVSKKVLEEMNPDKYAANNISNVASNKATVYNVNREKKSLLLKKLDLGSCKLANISRAEESINKKDLDMRQLGGDQSTDNLGILRLFSMHSGFRMHLYGKAALLLLGKLSLSGKLVLYLDATGQMIRLPGSPYSDKILHSKLSIQPRDIMITGQDIPYGNKIYSLPNC